MQYNQEVRAGVGLIGRDEEIDTLTRFLGGSGRRALVIRGEAGVGKTAMAEEIVDRAVAAGWRVVRATGVEAETSFALSGLNQIVFALRPELAALGDDDQDVLAPVLGADATSAPAPMPLTMALLSLLTQAARHDPLLLVVEDMHWFDDVSAGVLNAAGRRLSDPRLRFLATARPRQAIMPVRGGRSWICAPSPPATPHVWWTSRVVVERVGATDDPRRGRWQSAGPAGVAPQCRAHGHLDLGDAVDGSSSHGVRQQTATPR